MSSQGEEFFKQLAANSQRVPYAFPLQTNRLATLHAQAANQAAFSDSVLAFAHTTYPIASKGFDRLLWGFLQHKRVFGTGAERALYATMTQPQLVHRLLTKRPLAFWGGADCFLLRDGHTRGEFPDQPGFESVGSDTEQAPFVLRDLLSYDEMQLSALLGMSTPTPFVNAGARSNRGVPDAACVPSGVLVGLVGARFEKPGLMEWQHMLVDAEQNTTANGYGRKAAKRPLSAHARLLALWAAYYNLPHGVFPSFDEVAARPSPGFLLVRSGVFLNIQVYKARIAAVLAPLLSDANARAAANHTRAYVHVVGLGLGVWMVSEQQGQFVVDVVAELVRERALPAVSDVDFSWFPSSCVECGGAANGQLLAPPNGNKVCVHFSKRSPADVLSAEDQDKLLVAVYAWDSNAYPGNEYWAGHLDASGDPAAACCSCIGELQNPDVNPYVDGNRLKLY